MGNKHPRNRKKVEDVIKTKKKGDRFTSADLMYDCNLTTTEIGCFLKDIKRVQITGKIQGRNINVWEVIA